MKKTVCSLFAAIVLVSSLFFPVISGATTHGVVSSSTSTETDKLVYEAGETIVVTGYVTPGFYSSNQMRLDLYKGWFDWIDSVHVVINQDGYFYAEIPTSESLLPGTDYVVNVYHSIDGRQWSASNTFEIQAPSISNVPQTDKQLYAAGETIVVTGRVTPGFYSSNQMRIDLYKGWSHWIDSVHTTTDSNGFYQVELPTSPNLQSGSDYMIQVFHGIDGRLWNVSEVFIVE